MMKIAFICGPFRAKDTTNGYNFFEQRRNIERARDVALLVMQTPGFFAYCPHMNTADFQGALPDDVFLLGNNEMLKRCDLVVCAEGWQSSEGSRAEITIAEAMPIPVYYDIDQFLSEEGHAS